MSPARGLRAAAALALALAVAVAIGGCRGAWSATEPESAPEPSATGAVADPGDQTGADPIDTPGVATLSERPIVAGIPLRTCDDIVSAADPAFGPGLAVSIWTGAVISVVTGEPFGGEPTDEAWSDISDTERKALIAHLESMIDDTGRFCGYVAARPERWRE